MKLASEKEVVYENKDGLSNSDITVVIPTLNEAENISEVIDDLSKLGYNNILVVDAKSTDKTVKIAEDLGAKVIFQTGNGKGNALREAFIHQFAEGDIIITMDADGSMSAKEIPILLEALNSGADLVKGSRFLSFGHSQDMTFLRRIGNQFFIFLVNRLHSTNYSDLCYGFAAFRRDAIEKLHPHLKSTNFEIETEVFIKAKKLGLKVMEVPSVEYPRKNGRSNLSVLKDGIRILRTIIQETLY